MFHCDILGIWDSIDPGKVICHGLTGKKHRNVFISSFENIRTCLWELVYLTEESKKSIIP